MPFGQEKLPRSFGQKAANGLCRHLKLVSKKRMYRLLGVTQHGLPGPVSCSDQAQLHALGRLLVEPIFIDSFHSCHHLIQLPVGNKPVSGPKENADESSFYTG